MNFPLILKKPHKKRLNSGKHTLRRFMSKSGHLNLQLTQVPCKYLRFTKDFGNTLISLRWRWVILITILANFVCYLLFTGFFMLDAWLSGDFSANKTDKFCIEDTRTFVGYLQLSMQTITTTGYGYVTPNENCKLADFILIFSTICTVLIDGIFISFVYLKLFKPLRKDSLTLFSKKCVVSLRNGKLVLTLRVNDHWNKHTIEPEISIFLVTTDNSQVEMSEIHVKSPGVFLWPTDVVHEINEDSPFWKFSASDFLRQRFELLVTFSGVSLVTGQHSASQTSYLNDEILWGYRFSSCIEYDDKMQKYTINQGDIFKIVPCDTPLCSAQALQGIEKELNESVTE